MREIPLSNGGVALVDDDDYERLARFRWRARRRGRSANGYVQRSVRLGTRFAVIQMHRQIMNAAHGQMIDHVNRNPLDNRKANLRFCTMEQNQMNKKKMRGSYTSTFKGVRKICRSDHWNAYIYASYGKDLRIRIDLGRFEDEREAAKAYDSAAVLFFGEFAWLNNPYGFSSPQRSAAS